MLDILIEVLKIDEGKAKEAIDSLVSLITDHAGLFESDMPRLVELASTIMTTKEFDDKT